MLPSTSFSLRRIQWLIWIVLYAVHVLAILPYDPPGQAMLYSVINVGSYVLIVYGNASLLMPRLYDRNKKPAYVLLAILLVAGIAFLRYLASFYAYNLLYAPKPSPFRWSAVGSSLISSILIYISSILFYIALNFFRLKQKQEQLQKQHAASELKLLKAQVQPHFLFNTLNNIYYVAHKESPATAALIEQLSQIMRYFVDEAPKEKIELAKELDFIRNYILLENMRMRYPVITDIQVPDEMNHINVPPMLLIPLVENVFKHGVDKLRNDNFIRLAVIVMQNRLDITTENLLLTDKTEKESGTGLANLTARLQLLYGKDFTLSTGAAGKHYQAHLNIPL